MGVMVKRVLTYTAVVFITLLIFVAWSGVCYLVLDRVCLGANEIDLGYACTNRGAINTGYVTRLLAGYPSPASGTLHTMQIYVNSAMNSTNKVATFYNTGGNNWKVRDSQSFPSLASGTYYSFAIDLDIAVGDLVGVVWYNGAIERDSAGGNGWWEKSGDYCDVDDEATYTFNSGDLPSIHFYGDEILIPDCPTGLDVTQTDLDAVLFTWDPATVTEYYTLRGSYIGVPTSNTSGYLVYSGTSTTCNKTGLDLNSTHYYFSLWNIAGGTSTTCLEYVEIGGENLEIEVALPMNLWVFLFASFMLVCAIFFKKMLLYIALVPLWLGVIATAGVWYIDASAGIVLLFAILGIYTSARKQASGGV